MSSFFKRMKMTFKTTKKRKKIVANLQQQKENKKVSLTKKNKGFAQNEQIIIH